MDSPYILKNANLELGISRTNGAIVSLSAIQTGWQILDRPHLGLSFRLLVPLREPQDWHTESNHPRNHAVYGEKQTLSSFETPAENVVRLTWNSVQPEAVGGHPETVGVLSEAAGFLPIKVTTTYTLETERVIIATTVENHSAYRVENVYSPYLGDVSHPRDEAWFKTFLYSYATAVEWPLWPNFQNLRGYYGWDYPVQMGSSMNAGAPTAPFILLRGEKQGLYVGVASPSAELVAWQAELRPGWGSSIDSRQPESRLIAGKDVAIRFAAVHIPYIQPGETRALTPIAIAAYQGSWHQGVAIYRRWRDTWMARPRIPAWASGPHAWQQLHINSPEDELRLRFTDLPQIAEECARQGVRAIQLVGWNDGGQDQGNPSHDPDPRLGTFAELKDAIHRCHAMGVKIVLFAKFTWADRATPSFRYDLVRMAIKDPYGDYYLHPGYQYQTATQIMDINTKRLVPMCFQSDEYLRLCDQEFKKALELGAAGILFDECLHHGPALLCFDENHGHRYGAPVYANDRRLIQNFSRLSTPIDPEFLYAGEACYDWEMEAYHLSYFRSENKAHIPLSRFMLPEGLFMTAVTGFNDRNMVNQCLMYRYIISYEPFNFKGRLGDYPQTVAYGRQMDALRTELRHYFWDGEFQDVLGALVTHAGKLHQPFAAYTDRQNGLTGLVICNYNEAEAIVVQASLDSGQPLNRYRLVDDPTWMDVKEGIHIPPSSAVVVI
jgi:Domain of unknown function (DUF6259)